MIAAFYSKLKILQLEATGKNAERSALQREQDAQHLVTLLPFKCGTPIENNWVNPQDSGKKNAWPKAEPHVKLANLAN